MSISPIIGRASTPAEKRVVIERIHAAWCAVPGVRLGELMMRAMPRETFHFTEDTTLAELCEAFAKEHAR